MFDWNQGEIWNRQTAVELRIHNTNTLFQRHYIQTNWAFKYYIMSALALTYRWGETSLLQENIYHFKKFIDYKAVS